MPTKLICSKEGSEIIPTQQLEIKFHWCKGIQAQESAAHLIWIFIRTNMCCDTGTYFKYIKR